MSDIKELIETLDFFLEVCQEANEYEGCEHRCEDDLNSCEYSENLIEIKKILEQQDEFIIVEKGNKMGEIRKLLQGKK